MAKSAPKKKTKPKIDGERVKEEFKGTNERSRKLVRSKRDKMIGGVAGGIAEYFEIDPIIIRLLFVLIGFSIGSGVLIYIILWIIIPEEGDESLNNSQVIKKNSVEFEKTVEGIVENRNNRKMFQLLFGLGIVLCGVYMILGNLGLTNVFNIGWFLSKFWPVAIIALGVFILVGNNKDEK